MALKFKKRRAKSVSFGVKRSTKSIKYIVLHYTGNKGDTAKNNVDYFATGNTRQAGAHYFIDGKEYVYKSVPVNRVAYAVGGFYGRANGAAKFYGRCTNANSLSIEMCDSVKSVPAKTYKQAVELTKFLMKKYDVPASRVLRHWDVSGKSCPAPWIGTSNKSWKQFKKDISGTVQESSGGSGVFTVGSYDKVVEITKDCPVRSGRGKIYKKLDTFKKGKKVKALYIGKNSAGNLWASVDYGSNVGYIYLGNAKPL